MLESYHSAQLVILDLAHKIGFLREKRNKKIGILQNRKPCLQNLGPRPLDDYRHLSGVSIEIRLPPTIKERAKANIEQYGGTRCK